MSTCPCCGQPTLMTRAELLEALRRRLTERGSEASPEEILFYMEGNQ